MGSGEKESKSTMTSWEAAIRGKSRREIASIHEARAEAEWERGLFDNAQKHLGSALEIWTEYEEPPLVARVWCLKGICSGESKNFKKAKDFFEKSEKLAEQADDMSLALCALVNRAICEAQIGECRAATIRARRVFEKAEAEGNLELALSAHIIRAFSDQLEGNFSSASREYDEANRLTMEPELAQLTPSLRVATDTNSGICALRSSKPEQAVARLERALKEARTLDDNAAPWTLARCLFHLGEALRQLGDIASARSSLEKAAAIADRASAAAEERGDGEHREEWSMTAVEVANSRGLCTLSAGAQAYVHPPPPFGVGDAARTRRSLQLAVGTRAANVTRIEGDGPSGSARRGAGYGEHGGDEEGRGSSEASAALAAIELILDGGKAAEAGGHPMQKAVNVVLEGVAWSLEEGGSAKGMTSLKRSERMLEKMLATGSGGLAVADHPMSPSPRSFLVGGSGWVDSRSDAQLAKLELGLLCNQVAAARGGIGLGVALSSTTRVGASSGARGKPGTIAQASSIVAENAPGWARLSELIRKYTARASQAAGEVSRQLSVANAHAGALELMAGRASGAAAKFARQLDEARKAGDVLLEALAERNLTDTRECEGDVHGALRHLRRCRDLAKRAGSIALETDTYRRLSSIYAEIAAEAAQHDPLGRGREATRGVRAAVVDRDGSIASSVVGDGWDEDSIEEADVEAREDVDITFLRERAAERARLFAERYANAARGLAWPIGRGADLAERRKARGIVVSKGGSDDVFFFGGDAAEVGTDAAETAFLATLMAAA